NARADIAVINGVLKGYEIKSDADSLNRLNSQISYYEKTFEKCTIVVGKKFEKRIVDEVPESWGIICAYENRFGNVSLKNIRPAKFNKNVTYKALTDVLWNDEIKKLLRENNIKGYSSKNKFQLLEMVEQNFSLTTLKNYTREILKSREGWRVV
ncbi:sce7726 family protein, partial [Enterococcus malodoratus]|uniref:sce7726 family protein n=1 Tax=Enterococcus malodoratus TaxID=71451 RepID=UPI0020745042